MKDANDLIRNQGAAGLRVAFDRAVVSLAQPVQIPVNGATKPTSSAEIIRVSSVQAQPIKWLWPSRMALGKVTMVAGNPGLGKSQFTTYLASQVSNGGNWPAREGSCPHGSVLMLSAEDDIADTIRPRLEAAGADINRVHVLIAIKEATATRGFNLALDLQQLEKALTDIGDVKLIIIDPITAYLGATDSHKTADVRALLAPVSDLAARHGVAIIAISHLNKGGGSEAMVRITGSLAFVAAARGAYLIQKDPGDSTRRLFLPIKNNLGVDNAGLAFRIVERETNGGIRAPAIEWEDGRVTMSADEALAAASANDGEEGAALREAVEFLSGELKVGPVSQKTIKADATANGISERTLRRAKSTLGVVTRKMGMKEGWTWELPGAEGGQAGNHLATFEDGHENPKMARQKGVDTFGNFGPLRAECRTPERDEPPAKNTGVILPGADSATDVPAPYVQPFRALQSACPDEVPKDRWLRCLDDARLFFRRWGQQAQRLGWSPQDLMALHPTAPLARHDQMGLLWALRGQTVIDLGAKAAKLSGGLSLPRRSS
jgi:putative DNA primase/helicase